MNLKKYESSSEFILKFFLIGHQVVELIESVVPDLDLYVQCIYFELLDSLLKFDSFLCQ